MTTYRLYFMDAFRGSISRYDEFQAETEEAAFERAESWAGRDRLELWCGHRRLRQYDPVGPAARSPHSASGARAYAG